MLSSTLESREDEQEDYEVPSRCDRCELYGPSCYLVLLPLGLAQLRTWGHGFACCKEVSVLNQPAVQVEIEA